MSAAANVDAAPLLSSIGELHAEIIRLDFRSAPDHIKFALVRVAKRAIDDNTGSSAGVLRPSPAMLDLIAKLRACETTAQAADVVLKETA